MKPTEAAKLVDCLRDNWDTPAWSQGRYDLFVEAILPYPYPAAAHAIGGVIRRGVRSYRVLVNDVTDAVELEVAARRRLEQQRQDRLLLTGPKDPSVGNLLRDTIKRLEARSRAAGGEHAEGGRVAGERGRGQAARRRPGVGPR